MKYLVIDIDEQHFEILQSAVRNGMGDNSQKIIANGIPLDIVLDKIRAEIMLIEGLEDAIEIIDKYRGEQE